MQSLRRYQLWNKWMSAIPAPQDYIDLSYFWLIGAALQRRIYLQSEEKPLFPNTYVILVGKPGLGKGLAIDPVIDALKFHKLRDITKNLKTNPGYKKPDIDLSKLTAEQQTLLAATAKVEQTIEELADKNKQKSLKEPLLFPVAPDDITYEDLVHTMAGSIRRLNVTPTPILAPNGSYGHCSMAVGLSEMATLFKKQSEKCLKFMLKAFDCGDYEYSTKHQGHDLVKRCCLSVLAGTTPGQIQDMLDNRIIDAGWSSRCIFVWADAERFQTFYIRDFTEEQKLAYIEVLDHLKDLARIFGRVEYSPEALEFLIDYFSSTSTYKNSEPNLEPYYKRKNIHVPKFALAIHFSEAEILWQENKPIYDNVLSLREVKLAAGLLERIERSMHLALCIGRKNPAAELSDKILHFMQDRRNGPVDDKLLLMRFWNDMPNGVVTYREAMDHLISVNKIKVASTKQLAYEIMK